MLNHLLKNILYFRRYFTVSGRYLCHKRSYSFYRTSFEYGLNVLPRCFTYFKFPFVSFVGKILFEDKSSLNNITRKMWCAAYWSWIGVSIAIPDVLSTYHRLYGLVFTGSSDSFTFMPANVQVINYISIFYTKYNCKL